MKRKFNLTIASAKFIKKNGKKSKDNRGRLVYKIDHLFKLTDVTVDDETISGRIDGERAFTYYDLKMSETAEQLLGF